MCLGLWYAHRPTAREYITTAVLLLMGTVTLMVTATLNSSTFPDDDGTPFGGRRIGYYVSGALMVIGIARLAIIAWTFSVFDLSGPQLESAIQHNALAPDGRPPNGSAGVVVVGGVGPLTREERQRLERRERRLQRRLLRMQRHELGVAAGMAGEAEAVPLLVQQPSAVAAGGGSSLASGGRGRGGGGSEGPEARVDNGVEGGGGVLDEDDDDDGIINMTRVVPRDDSRTSAVEPLPGLSLADSERERDAVNNLLQQHRQRQREAYNASVERTLMPPPAPPASSRSPRPLPNTADRDDADEYETAL